MQCFIGCANKSVKKEKIVHEIQIAKSRDFFLQDKNRFERPEQ